MRIGDVCARNALPLRSASASPTALAEPDSDGHRDAEGRIGSTLRRHVGEPHPRPDRATSIPGPGHIRARTGPRLRQVRSPTTRSR